MSTCPSYSIELTSYIYSLSSQSWFPPDPLRWVVLSTLSVVYQTHTFQNTDITSIQLEIPELCILPCGGFQMSKWIWEYHPSIWS